MDTISLSDTSSRADKANLDPDNADDIIQSPLVRACPGNEVYHCSHGANGTKTAALEDILGTGIAQCSRDLHLGSM